MRRHLLPIGCLFVATSAAAAPSPLSGEAIRETVSGATVEIDTPLGTKLPIRYSDDGRMAAEAPGLAFVLGSPADSGRWWIAGDRLCHKWTRWFDGDVQCLRLGRDGARYVWQRDDGKTGTATVAMRSVAPPPYALGQQPRIDRPEPGSPSAAAPVAGQAPRGETAKIARLPEPAPQNSVRREPSHQRPPVENKPAEVGASPSLEAASASAAPKAVAPPIRRATEQPPNLAAQTAPPPAPSFRVAGVDLHDVLNVRDGPSADHPPVGAIPPRGQGVKIVGPCLSEWCPIDHRGIRGWVNSTYLIEETLALGSARESLGRSRLQ